MKSNKTQPFLGRSLGLLLVICSVNVMALDDAAVEFGLGDDSTDLIRLDMGWDWNVRWLETEDWHLGGYWELDVGYWDGKNGEHGAGDLFELGFTPVFRFQRNPYTDLAIAPYVEGAIGAHLLSETWISGRDLSTNFQFGSHIGLGMRVGKSQRLDLGYRFQHLSNGSIKGENDGINFHIVRLSYRF
jgi:lipid A 3-O-deacylase